MNSLLDFGLSNPVRTSRSNGFSAFLSETYSSRRGLKSVSSVTVVRGSSSGGVMEEKSFLVVREYRLRALLSAHTVITFSFIPWYFIFKYTVEGTMPTELRVVPPKIQL
ncbi:hypothetical protein QL285_019949 [Trifolium repens]|nr:hypothetical protein QL285_019949 [Trifolium repens]